MHHQFIKRQSITEGSLFGQEKPESGAEEEKQQTIASVVTLKNLELKVKKGEFLCVIGDVGSGKSSLLNTLIGDLLYVSP